jgi:hypothetical protein
MRILKDILSIINVEKLKEELLSVFNNKECNVVGALIVLEKLKSIKPKKCTDGMIIIIEECSSIDEKDFWLGVYGRVPGVKQIYTLEFISWPDWLGCFVSEDDILKYGLEKYLGMVLYEMTFCGYEENSVEEHLNEFLDNHNLKSIKKELEEEF